MDRRLKPGDLCVVIQPPRIQGTTPVPARYVGAHCTILRPAPKRDMPWPRWMVSIDGREMNAAEIILRKVRDGDPPGSWDDCVWKPRRETA